MIEKDKDKADKDKDKQFDQRENKIKGNFWPERKFLFHFGGFSTEKSS